MSKRDEFWSSVPRTEDDDVVWPEELEARKELATNIVGARWIGAAEHVLSERVGELEGVLPAPGSHDYAVTAARIKVLSTLSHEQRSAVLTLLRDVAYFSGYWPLVKVRSPVAYLEVDLVARRVDDDGIVESFVLNDFLDLHQLFGEWQERFADGPLSRTFSLGMDDETIMHAVRDIDWSRFAHAWGKATDVPAMWERFLRGEQERPDEIPLVLAVAYERTVHTVTAVIVPLLVQVAKSTHRRRADALCFLGFALGNVGRPLRQKQKLAERAARSPIPNPFKPGQFLEAAPPDPALLREEDRWVEAMEREIERDVNTWMDALDDPDPSFRDAAAHLLACVHHHERTAQARERARAAQVKDEWMRKQIEWALKFAGKWHDR